MASDGTLTIRDGQITKIVNLDPTQLREGRILYTPLFRELSVRLEVSDNQRRMGGESVQVLGWDTNPSAGYLSDLSIPTAGAPQRSESLAPLPPVAATAVGSSKDSAANHVGMPATLAPSGAIKESQAPRLAEGAKTPAPKAIVVEAPQTPQEQPPLTETSSAVAMPAQTPSRTVDAAVARPETPAAPTPVPNGAVPLVAAAPAPATSKPASSQPVSSQPVASQPITSQPVNVTSNLQEAKLIKMVTPIYPLLARATRIQGTVTFNANIGGDGRIRKLQYKAGPQVLVSAAADAVKQWIYRPTLLNGQPIEVNTIIDVKFLLNQK